jgi:hypothetical protein
MAKPYGTWCVKLRPPHPPDYGGRPFVESDGHSRGLILPRHEIAQRTKSETRVRSLAYARK